MNRRTLLGDVVAAITGLFLPRKATQHVYGGTSDLWGESLTAADVNSLGFGFAIPEKSHRGYVTGRAIYEV